MNKQRRKELAGIVKELNRLKGQVEILRDDEQESFDNMPPGLQEGERGSNAEEAIEVLESLVDNLTNDLNQLCSVADITPPEPTTIASASYKAIDRRRKSVSKAERLLVDAGYFVIKEDDNHFRQYLNDGDGAYSRMSYRKAIRSKRDALHAEVKALFEEYRTLLASKP